MSQVADLGTRVRVRGRRDWRAGLASTAWRAASLSRSAQDMVDVLLPAMTAERSREADGRLVKAGANAKTLSLIFAKAAGSPVFRKLEEGQRMRATQAKSVLDRSEFLGRAEGARLARNEAIRAALKLETAETAPEPPEPQEPKVGKAEFEAREVYLSGLEHKAGELRSDLEILRQQNRVLSQVAGVYEPRGPTTPAAATQFKVMGVERLKGKLAGDEGLAEGAAGVFELRTAAALAAHGIAKSRAVARGLSAARAAEIARSREALREVERDMEEGLARLEAQKAESESQLRRLADCLGLLSPSELLDKIDFASKTQEILRVVSTQTSAQLQRHRRRRAEATGLLESLRGVTAPRPPRVRRGTAICVADLPGPELQALFDHIEFAQKQRDACHRRTEALRGQLLDAAGVLQRVGVQIGAEPISLALAPKPLAQSLTLVSLTLDQLLLRVSQRGLPLTVPPPRSLFPHPPPASSETIIV